MISLRSVLAAAATAYASSSSAQAGLDLARVLCGFPPGGSTDAIARHLADRLRGGYATNAVVDNKPGAGGQIAIGVLRDSAADGSVLLLTPSSMLSLYPIAYSKLPYVPATDVAPVSTACWLNHGLGVGPAVPASVKKVKDFITWARTNPAKANCGSPARVRGRPSSWC